MTGSTGGTGRMAVAGDERVVVVTGGGTGIGRALAAAFHAAGARVAIASRNPDNLKKATQVLSARGDGAGRLLPVRVDVRVRDLAGRAAAQVAEAWGRVDVLVNNAGVSGRNPIEEADAEAADARWREILETNLNGMYYMTRACLPLMSEGGRIINISSVLGKFGVPGYTAYCTSKHGVVGFTRALAAELAPRRITVNAICPGWVDTSMAHQGISETAASLGVTPEEFHRTAMDRVPLGRILRPEEVAPLALYIASPEAEAMTGQAVNIEGGATTW